MLPRKLNMGLANVVFFFFSKTVVSVRRNLDQLPCTLRKGRNLPYVQPQYSSSYFIVNMFSGHCLVGVGVTACFAAGRSSNAILMQSVFWFRWTSRA